MKEERLRRIYQTQPERYLRAVLDFHPWAGCRGKGQLELVRDIGESVRKQLAGEPADKWFKVDAGHGVGKTIVAAGLVNWFFDCFPYGITYTTAPSDHQVKKLLWKYIKALRRDRGLPGRVLPEDARMEMAEDWFAIGFTTSDAGGKGSERAQGQHALYQFFVIDEAEGVPDFYFDAIEGMMTGGHVVVVLMLANPKTRTSRYHRKGKETGVRNYRLSVLDHPNVVYGRDVVPGATRRAWAEERIVKWCTVVPKHDEEAYTFTVDYPVSSEDVEYPPGTIFKPEPEFYFRVLGVAPANLAGRNFVSPGRYESATKREPDRSDARSVTIGVDCARFGTDFGTVYVRHRNVAWRAARIERGDTFAYLDAIKAAALDAKAAGAVDLSVRVDGTGGFGAGIVDGLRADEELQRAFVQFNVVEVQFGAGAHDPDKYADVATEMYAHAAETLAGIRIERIPNELEVDLTDRPYEYVNRAGKTLKRLQPKEIFRKKHLRSPDDGDGFVLAVAPEFIFTQETAYVHAADAAEGYAQGDYFDPYGYRT